MCKHWARLAMASAACCCLLILLAAVSVHGCSITLRNHCSFGVTACAQSGPDAISEYILGPGVSQILQFPSCTWQSGTIWRSVSLQCVADGGGPSSANDKELANLAEFNIEPGRVDYYDLSNVNAYNIGLRIGPVEAPDCTPISCSISDITAFCGEDDRLESFSSGALSCINTDGSQGLGPTDSTRRFKDACPSAYSYNYDDATSTFTCAHGTSYDVTFCPASEG